MVHCPSIDLKSFATNIFLCLSWTMIWPVSQAHTVSASPHAFTVSQPDGTEVRLHIRGNELSNWLEDTQGYTVIQENQRYLYAVPSGLESAGAQSATPSQFEVGKVDPASLAIPKRLIPPKRPDFSSKRMSREALRLESVPAAITATGAIRNIVILMRFADHSSRILPSESDFDVIFNQPGGDPVLAPTGSVRDLYLENSYGMMQLDSTVFTWVDLPQTEAHYADGDSGLTLRIRDAIRDALNLADAQIDFSQFDSDGDKTATIGSPLFHRLRTFRCSRSSAGETGLPLPVALSERATCLQPLPHETRLD